MFVSRFRKFSAWLLAAVWLLGTQHCGLAAAGLWFDHGKSASGCATGGGCENDSCDTVEGGAYKSSGGTLKVQAPDLLALACLFCPCPIPEITPKETAGFSTAFLARPLDWVPIWQCVQRAALLPRAPSLVAA